MPRLAMLADTTTIRIQGNETYLEDLDISSKHVRLVGTSSCQFVGAFARPVISGAGGAARSIVNISGEARRIGFEKLVLQRGDELQNNVSYGGAIDISGGAHSVELTEVQLDHSEAGLGGAISVRGPAEPGTKRANRAALPQSGRHDLGQHRRLLRWRAVLPQCLRFRPGHRHCPLPQHGRRLRWRRVSGQLRRQHRGGRPRQCAGALAESSRWPRRRVWRRSTTRPASHSATSRPTALPASVTTTAIASAAASMWRTARR
jgi:hypothetical protein